MSKISPPQPAVSTAVRRSFFKTQELIATVPRDNRSECRVRLVRDVSGNTVLDVRVFEEFAGPARVRGPTKIGLSMPLEQAPDLAEAFVKALVVARELGWIGGGL